MKNTLSILVLFLALNVSAQEKMILFFKDKSPTEEAVPFSERSLEKRRQLEIVPNELDVPVSARYLEELRQNGRVIATSRWLNAVVFESHLSAEVVLELYAFVDRIRTVEKSGSRVSKTLPLGNRTLQYGVTAEQTEQINLDCLHDLGYTGSNVILAVIDAGFVNMDSIPYFDSVYVENRVLDTYNFVNPGMDVYNSSGHGTAVSSCIVGVAADTLPFLGTAVDVNLALYLTEDVASETEIEEFNLVMALERCDSIGVDVVNISLGYFEFDDSTSSHVYADLDGMTTIAAQGVNVAKSKGMAVVTSAGNAGPNTISTPCDSDGALCVGAIDEFDAYAPFSSVGPSYDLDVKPDVVARGFQTWLINDQGMILQGSGTSFSSPIIAGATACLMQANPGRTVDEIFNAIRESAHQYTSPDSLLGYGIPDFCLAHDLLNPPAGLKEFHHSEPLLYPNPSAEKLTIRIEGSEQEEIHLRVFDSMGKEVINKTLLLDKMGEASLNTSFLQNGVYTVLINDAFRKLVPVLTAH